MCDVLGPAVIAGGLVFIAFLVMKDVEKPVEKPGEKRRKSFLDRGRK